VILYPEQNQTIPIELKTLALFVVTLLGTQYLVIMLSSKNLTMFELEELLSGTASTQRVK
jgi:hypothetical protein